MSTPTEAIANLARAGNLFRAGKFFRALKLSTPVY